MQIPILYLFLLSDLWSLKEYCLSWKVDEVGGCSRKTKAFVDHRKPVWHVQLNIYTKIFFPKDDWNNTTKFVYNGYILISLQKNSFLHCCQVLERKQTAVPTSGVGSTGSTFAKGAYFRNRHLLIRFLKGGGGKHVTASVSIDYHRRPKLQSRFTGPSPGLSTSPHSWAPLTHHSLRVALPIPVPVN